MSEKTKYEEHVVAFIDLLGFKDMVRAATDEERDNILGLLQAFADLSSDAFMRVQPTETGYSLDYKPTVTSFSDSIVISYPLAIMRKIDPSDKTYPKDSELFRIIHHLCGLVGSLAREAWKLRILVRGGVTIGEMYHSKNVIFGDAYLEAYELESKAAIYPRVILSNKLVKRFKWNGNTFFFFYKGYDGICELNYIWQAIHMSVPMNYDFSKNVKEFMERTTIMIERKLQEL